MHPYLIVLYILMWILSFLQAFNYHSYQTIKWTFLILIIFYALMGIGNWPITAVFHFPKFFHQLLPNGKRWSCSNLTGTSVYTIKTISDTMKSRGNYNLYTFYLEALRGSYESILSNPALHLPDLTPGLPIGISCRAVCEDPHSAYHLFSVAKRLIF